MLLNMALKTWVFTKADQSYFYPPAKIDCEAIKASDQSKAYPLPPDCTDPNFAENQRRAEEDNRKAQKQREASTATSMLVIAAPIWYIHWRLARKEQ